MSYSKYYTATVEIKDCNVLIDGKRFYDIPIKSKEKAYEKIVEMSKGNDYKTANLLNYDYFSKHYRHIGSRYSRMDQVKFVEDSL